MKRNDFREQKKKKNNQHLNIQCMVIGNPQRRRRPGRQHRGKSE